MQKPPRPNPYRDAWAGDLDAERAGTTARVAGWVHRRRDHGGLIFVDLRDRSGIVQLVFHPDQPEAFAAAERLRPEHVLSAHGEVVRRAPENVNPNIPTGRDRGAGRRGHAAGGGRDAAVPDRRGHARRRDAAAAPPDARPAPRGDARRARPARRRHPHDARDARRRGLPGDRDADPHALDAGGRARLPRPQPPRAGHVVRAAAVAAALQAAADDERLRALLPDRPLLPRRGHARRSPGGVHAARRRDGLRRGGRRPRRHGAPHGQGVRARPASTCPRRTVAARALRRGDAALGLGPPGPALRPGDRRRRRRAARIGLQGLRVRARAAAAWSARSTPARQSLSRSELDGLNEVVQRHGGKAVAWATVEESGAWRSPIAKFLGPERTAAAGELLDASLGDLLLFVADERDVAATALGGLRLELGRRFGLIPRTSTTCTGSSTSRCSSARRRGGRRCTTRSPRPAAPSTTPAACARAATTSSSTAPSSAAARSASTTPRCSARSSRSSGWTRTRPSAVRVPARRAALRRAAARRHRVRHRPDRRAHGRPRLHPRRHRLPEDRQRPGPADRRARRDRRAPAARARSAAAVATRPSGSPTPSAAPRARRRSRRGSA